MSTNDNNIKKYKKKKKKNPFFFILKLLFILIILIGIVGGIGTYLYVKDVLADTSPIDPSKIDDLLGENSIIYDSDGRVLEQIQNEGLRTIIRYEDMSKNLINAFVAVEDKTFWEHSGFNYVRLVGSVWQSVTTGKRIKGTSTITQQAARNLYLEETRSKRTINRKIKEAYYAIQLENYLTKEQIIEAYLNKIYLGSGSNGVEAAAKTFFSKEAKDLDLIESAMLAGIPSLPPSYSPMINKRKVDVTPDDYILDDTDGLYTLVYNSNCESRYSVVIQLMHQNNYITDAEYEVAKTTDLKTKLHPNRNRSSEISSYFADMVKSDVINDLMEKYNYTSEEANNLLYTKGLEIYSTIDFDIQKTLENSYSSKNFTPYFGESAASAVRLFQKQNGLSADGSAGKNTLAKMAELDMINPTDFSLKSYGKGVEHEDVIILKKALDKANLLKFNENFPKVTVFFNKNKDIISADKSKLLLYKYENLINSNNQLVIPKADYKYDEDGNIILLKNRRLYFYPHYQDDKLANIQVVIKNSYKYDEESNLTTRNSNGSYNIVNLNMYRGKDILIPADYKSLDKNKNLIIDKSLINEKPDFFKKDNDGNLLVNTDYFVISETGVIQPQSAMVIIDYRTGQLKAIVGGRNITGQKIYNRAINPRQPGSAIKPLGVYLPAIDSKKMTAATVMDDVPSYLGVNPEERWPVNWYEYSSFYKKHWGLQTLRRGIEYSINVIAVKVVKELGVDYCYDYLKKFNFSTMVDSGYYNDVTLSSVALGGMTKGLTPLELTSAYGALANGGIQIETITYTKVLDNNGNVLLFNEPKKTKIAGEQEAFIVSDMIHSVVTNGIAKAAAIYPGNKKIPVAGKTGTTSDQLDAWFVGYTPYYVAGVWFGNDVNMPLDKGSIVSSKFWKTVMAEVHSGLEDKSFDVPSGLIKRNIDRMSGMLPSELSYEDDRNTVISEYFIPGTEPTEEDNVHVKALVCTESGKLANPDLCPITLTEEKVFIQREEPYVPEDHLDKYGNPIIIEDLEYQLPTELCDIHTYETIENYSGRGISPVIIMSDGSKITQRQFYVDLIDGSQVLVPENSVVLVSGSISFPDGSVIESSLIYSMPDLIPFQTDELPSENEVIEIDNSTNDDIPSDSVLFED